MSVIEASSATQQARRERRFAVELAAILRGDGADLPVQLRDLSRGGALATCRHPPAVHSLVTLVRGTLSVEARVAWAGRGRFGLEFAQPIRATDLLVQLSLSRSAPA